MQLIWGMSDFDDFVGMLEELFVMRVLSGSIALGFVGVVGIYRSGGDLSEWVVKFACRVETKKRTKEFLQWRQRQ